MESSQNAFVNELWTSEENQIFLNDRLSDEIKGHYQKIFREATYRAGLKSHLGFLTSGTTVLDAKSYKIVLISKEAFLESARTVNKYFILTSKDIWLQCLPRFHVGGLAVEARAYLAGFSVMSLAGPWNVETFYTALESTKATWSSLVPTQIYDIIQKQYRSPKKFRAFVGGGRLNPQLIEKAKDLGWNLIPTYGLSELSSMVATIENENLKFLPHVQYYIKEDKLTLKSKSLFTGYVQVVKGQVEFVKVNTTAGYFQTDDAVRKLGVNVMLLGRTQDVVKISGELVSLHKLRDSWYRYAGLDFAPFTQILALPDPRLENRVVLVIQKEEKYRDRSVLSHFHPIPAIIEMIKKFNESVLPFEKITGTYIVDSIPRTDLGKIQDKLLQQQLSAGQVSEVKINA